LQQQRRRWLLRKLRMQQKQLLQRRQTRPMRLEQLLRQPQALPE
jgi:hypothetical protein